METLPLVNEQRTSAGHTAALDPSGIDLYRRSDGRLVLRHDSDGMPSETPVHAVCCFPWAQPSRWVSIRDDKGKELALLETLDQVAESIRGLIVAELSQRFFMPEIVAIQAITDETELFHWRVTTNAGPRVFLTQRGEPPRTLSNDMVLVKDVANDLYLIRDVETLDARSRKIIWAHLD
jgi:hypothetical protein